jgi:hypothetical protein
MQAKDGFEHERAEILLSDVYLWLQPRVCCIMPIEEVIHAFDLVLNVASSALLLAVKSSINQLPEQSMRAYFAFRAFKPCIFISLVLL